MDSYPDMQKVMNGGNAMRGIFFYSAEIFQQKHDKTKWINICVPRYYDY